MTEKVYGNRTCRNCRGICHESSWRTKYGTRKSYFCSESCLRNILVNKLQKRLKLNKVSRWWEINSNNDSIDKMVECSYEEVIVITP